MTVIIGSPKPSDVDTVVRLVAMAQERSVGDVNRDIYVRACQPDPEFGEQFANLLMARDGNDIVGMAYRSWPHSWLSPVLREQPKRSADEIFKQVTEINSLAVEPTRRGEGIGRNLVEAIMADAQSVGIGAAMVTTRTPESTRFWESMGFVGGRVAIKFEGWGKLPFNPQFHGVLVAPIMPGTVTRTSKSVITIT